MEQEIISLSYKTKNTDIKSVFFLCYNFRFFLWQDVLEEH